MTNSEDFVKPNFGQGCISDIVPAIFTNDYSRLPISLNGNGPVVLLVLDGLGWHQLQERSALAPTLCSMVGGSITSVAPSTTAAALTSITTGMSPGEHGVVGYRFPIDSYVMNALTWRDNDAGDLRSLVPPETVQKYDAFMGNPTKYVSQAGFKNTGFTAAGWRGSKLFGYRTIGTLISHVVGLVNRGEDFVYAYYDGIDKVSHEYGFGSEFDSELAFADRLVDDLTDSLPPGTRIIVTADHGQVDCGDNMIELSQDLDPLITGLSGEGRFRWLHCKPSDIDQLAERASELYSDIAWVVTRDQAISEGWFGQVVSPEAKSRLGDVALLPFTNTAFHDPADTGPFSLRGRHGSLTAAEMLVPCISGSA